MVFLVLLNIPVFALDDASLRNVDSIKNNVNNYLSQLPRLAKSILGDWKINIRYTDNNDTIDYGIVLEDGLVNQLTLSSLNDPDLEMEIMETVINNVQNSGNPRTAVRNALRNGDINYKTHGFISRLKFSLFLRFL